MPPLAQLFTRVPETSGPPACVVFQPQAGSYLSPRIAKFEDGGA